MTDPELLTIIGDPRGPEVVTSSLSDEELARHLDTPAPEPNAIFWYDEGLDESLRRAPRTTKAQ